MECYPPIGWGNTVEVFPMIENDYSSKILCASKQKRILRKFFFEKLGIAPNYNSSHELAKLFNLLEYAFANGLSAEEGSSQMHIEVPDSLVASADTLLRRLKEADKNSVEKAFNNTVKRFMKSLDLQKCIIAIDYHDIPYYGDKNDAWVRGTKNQRGTNWCHQYATLEIVSGEKRFTLAVKKLSINDDEKALVIQELICIARKHVQISHILLDRGFYGIECIRVLKQLRFPFIMPVIKDAKMKPFMQENVKNVPGVVQYTIGKKGNCETFNLALKWLKKKDEPDEIAGFATNMNASVEEISELYSKRWSIETGYRSKKEFRVKTTTTNNIVRMIFFYLECLFYNAWYSIRGETKITIQSFRKILEITALKEIQAQSAVT